MNDPKQNEPAVWDPEALEDADLDFDAVYSDGYVAFQEGLSEDDCPYPEDEHERLETAWLIGWHDARADEPRDSNESLDGDEF